MLQIDTTRRRDMPTALPTAPVRTGVASVSGDGGVGGGVSAQGGGAQAPAEDPAAGWAAARAPVPRRTAAPPLGAAGWSGSRFWALAEDDSDSDEEAELGDAVALGAGGRPASSLGDFVARAEELGGSLKAGRRRAFAPGGPWLAAGRCGCAQSGSLGVAPQGSRQPCCARRGAAPAARGRPAVPGAGVPHGGAGGADDAGRGQP